MGLEPCEGLLVLPQISAQDVAIPTPSTYDGAIPSDRAYSAHVATQSSDQFTLDRVPDLSLALMSAYSEVDTSIMPSNGGDLVIAAHFTELRDHTSACGVDVDGFVEANCQDIIAGPIDQI